MTDLQVVGSTPLSSFVSIGDDAVDRETTSNFNGYDDVDGEIIRLYKRRLVPWRAGIAMVLFASLAAVAVLIVKCVAAFRREREESAVGRSLSEKAEDSSDPEDGVECAVEEESGSLSLPQQSTSAGGQEDDVNPPSAKRPRLDLSSADEGAGETSRTQSETDAALGLVMLSQQQPQASSSPSAVEAGETSAPSASPASPHSPQPSTSSGLLAQRPDSAAAGRLHAYARLPTLIDPNHGVVFNPERALVAPVAFSEAYQMLQRVRKLFAKDSLSTQELTDVVRMAEILASTLINNEAHEVSHMPLGRAVEVLARRFLLLDIVICTFQLLGTPPAGLWWDRIIRGVPHALPVRKPFLQRTGRDQQQFRSGLSEKLSTAIQIMKTGTRPSTRQLVDIKRLMFCSPFRTVLFQQSQWDPWRQDEEEARRNGHTDG